MRTPVTSGLSSDNVKKIGGRTSLKRLVETGEASKAVEFLISDNSSAVTGTCLAVDVGAQ